MAKIKTYEVTDAKDAAKPQAGLTKVLKTLGLDAVLKVKIPNAAWLEANAPDGKVDIVLEALLDPKLQDGPIKCIAKAGGQTSVLGIYTIKAAKDAAILKSLKAAALL